MLRRGAIGSRRWLRHPPALCHRLAAADPSPCAATARDCAVVAQDGRMISFEVNGMAKTAPMTAEALAQVSREARFAANVEKKPWWRFW